MSNFHLDLSALRGELIAVDDFRVHLTTGSRFAQRLDIRLVLPHGAAAHPVAAILEGTPKQTGSTPAGDGSEPISGIVPGSGARAASRRTAGAA